MQLQEAAGMLPRRPQVQVQVGAEEGPENEALCSSTGAVSGVDAGRMQVLPRAPAEMHVGAAGLIGNFEPAGAPVRWTVTEKWRGTLMIPVQLPGPWGGPTP